LFENLIQLVNIIGSIFYGTVLGIFLVAFYTKRVQAKPMFISALISQFTIFVIYYFMVYRQEKLGYLWLNFIGAILTIVLALLLQFLFFKGKSDDNELVLD